MHPTVQSLKHFLKISSALLAIGSTIVGCGSINFSSGSTHVSISVSPVSTTAQLGGSQQFTATVADTPNTAVTWQVNGVTAGNATSGTISATGLYAAPSAMPSSPTVTIAAVAEADTTKAANATVTLTAPASIVVTALPASANVQAEIGTQSFTATLANDSQNRGVTWSLSGAGCSGLTCGMLSNGTATSVTYAAPANAPSPSAVSLTATSVADPTKTGIAAITVTPAISVSVAPSSANVTVGKQQQFTATVSNDAQNKGVTWQVSGVAGGNATYGTISSTGLYTAPTFVPSPALVAVDAISFSDPAKNATAAVTVAAAATAPTVTLTASPTTITPGGNSTLTWSSTNATSCTASGGWTGTEATSGTFTVSPASTTAYTLTCTGAGGSSSPASATVTVSAASVPTVTLAASPITIIWGDSSNLSWSSTNATSCAASGGWTGTDATSGIFTVDPTSTTTYTLTCTGTGGSSTPASATVTVSAAASTPVTGITIPFTASTVVGSTTPLTATVLPFNATNQGVSWQSGSTAVATISSSGVVTGVSTGTAQITAKSSDGSNITSNACTVTVTTPASTNGQCGIATVNASSSAPTANLCMAGTASVAASGTGTNAGLWLWTCAGANGGTSTQCSSYTTRSGSSPTDGNGNVGATSYETLPFQSKITQPCWGCSNGLEPTELFFAANPKSIFNIFDAANGTTNSQDMYNSREGVSNYEQEGVVPLIGLQRWEDTYDASFPGPVSSSEPSYVAGDRAANAPENFPNLPEFETWRDFITYHPQYWDTANDGGTVTVEDRSWDGQEGYFPPMTPLDATDCPPDMSSCTWGDLYAYKISLVSALTGSYSVQLSDFSDSFPNGGTGIHGFNSRIVAAFAQQYAYNNLSGMTTSQQSSWIVANAFNQWNDFFSQGFGHWDGTLASRIGVASGRQGLVSDQCSGSPLAERDRAEDPRIVLQEMSTKNYICNWDNQSIQVGRDGPVRHAVLQSLGGAVLTSAYEPSVRYGANLESDDQPYWQAITTYYPTLTGGDTETLSGVSVTADQVEVGYKLMKRLWVWNAWAHIADRTGTPRRALAFTLRDYWDAGVLSASQLGPLQALIQGVVPTKPFGPAFYYSSNAMKVAEAYFGQIQGTGGNILGAANETNSLEGFLDNGGVGDYYISDAALGEIKAGSATAPSAWIIPKDWYLSPHSSGGLSTPDPVNSMSASELTQLEAIAPIVQTPAALAALSNQPLSYTTTGGPAGISSSCQSLGFGNSLVSSVSFATTQLTGFGFYDQNGRLIVVVSNASPCPDAVGLSGSINLGGLTAGSYTVTDLFANTSSRVTVSSDSVSIPVTVSRWDTMAFAIAQ